MYSSFDFVKLNALLRDFYNLTQVRITVFDDSLKEIASYPERIAPICRFIRENSEAEAECHRCDREACRRALAMRAPYVYRCHAGLTEAVSPVFMGNIIVAYAAFGHLFCYPEREMGRRAILNACRRYGLDEAKLGALIDGLPDMEEGYILSASHILDAVASYLYFDRMVTLKQQPLQVQIDEYISQHFTEDINAGDICKRFHIGRTALYEFSNQNYGMGIAGHIRKKRIDYAKQLLLTRPELNITQVAEACGYTDYNYFITVFGRLTGVSPRRYRALHGADERSHRRDAIPETALPRNAAAPFFHQFVFSVRPPD